MLNEIKIINTQERKIGKLQKIFKGIPSSPGIVFGKAVVLQPESFILPSERINEEQIPEDLKRLDTAVHDLVQEIISAMSKVNEDSKNVSAVLESDLMILTDESLIKLIKDRINLGFSTENSVIQEFDTQMHYLRRANDHVLRERAVEIENLKERLLAVLRNRCIYYGSGKNAIIVAQSLTPTDVINFKEAEVLGFITEIGGITSHSSILTRSYGIPQVIGIKEATVNINDDDSLVLDGYTGNIILNPKKTAISSYITRKHKEQEHKNKLGELSLLPSITLDGRPIKLLANIDIPDDIENAVLYGAEGIGLVRSEQMIISKNRIPSEDEQYEWYSALANRIYPNTVTIRAFDIGSDKYSEGMPRHESNPALGFRGIRYLLQRDDIFRIQLRAILRASKNKNVKLMLPMITCYSEVVKAVKIIEECKKELQEEKQSFDSLIPLGVMIETPAAAIISEKLSAYINFLSIGTNDLTQYTLAVDRSNEYVSSIYDSFHPSVLTLIKLTADSANKYKIQVSVCGELAGHSAATALLIGMGISELSVSPPILLELKKRVRETNFEEAKKLAEEVLDISDCENIRRKLSFD